MQLKCCRHKKSADKMRWTISLVFYNMLELCDINKIQIFALYNKLNPLCFFKLYDIKPLTETVLPVRRG